MMAKSALRVEIGKGDWVKRVRTFTDGFDRHYWDGCIPATAKAVEECERAVGRKLPADFREYLLRIGSGALGRRGGHVFYAPAEIVEACPGPLWMVLGSSDWASDEAQRRFYQTRGAFNPAPTRFTAKALAFAGHSLLDLLQIGLDGMCCYHQLYVGTEKPPFGYCLLTPEGTEEDRLPSFSEALGVILTRAREGDKDE